MELEWKANKSWKNGRHANFRSALNGSLARQLNVNNGWPGNKQARHNVLNQEPVFRKGFAPKNNWNVQYLYRGMHVKPNNINNRMSYSSWSTRKEVAENFAGRGLGNGSILRINTKLLKNIPVRILSREGEAETVLPPMRFILNKNSMNRNSAMVPIIPVTDVIVNARFSRGPNAKTFIPRVAARRLPVAPTPMRRLRALFRRR